MKQTPVFSGATQARKAQVKREMPNYAILHFATHGSLDSAHPLRSALILAPEPENSGEASILEAREIAGMSLTARLAVLSACETASGQATGGDGLVVLTWAFRAAGCPAVVATQWKINDSATTVLMRAFYRLLLAGQRTDDALRAAMQAVIVDKTRRLPYYWAAFQIYGDASQPMMRRSAKHEQQ
jgi:CHAT domain-containing protein